MADPLADLARLEGVPSAVAAARDSVDAVLRDRGMRRITPDQSATGLLASAKASAQMTDDPERWTPGSVRLSTELIALSPLIRVAPGQALARAHALLAYGIVDADDLGRVRSDGAVSERMTGLHRLLTTPTAASPIVLAAVAHAEIAVVEPFGGGSSAGESAGDGLLARAVEHLVLIDAGIDPRAVIVVEAGHLASGAVYAQQLQGYRDGGVTGVRNWLLHCTQALAYGVEVSPLSPR